MIPLFNGNHLSVAPAPVLPSPPGKTIVPVNSQVTGVPQRQQRIAQSDFMTRHLPDAQPIKMSGQSEKRVIPQTTLSAPLALPVPQQPMPSNTPVTTSAVIEAAPVLRNLQKEAAVYLPSSLTRRLKQQKQVAPMKKTERLSAVQAVPLNTIESREMVPSSKVNISKLPIEHTTPKHIAKNRVIDETYASKVSLRINAAPDVESEEDDD